MAPALFAQFETSEVLGSVHDASNANLPNATVTLINQATGIQATTTTNENGEYDFFDVQIGVYTVKVEHPGFSVATASDIRVAVGARQRVDMSMTVGEISQTVNVTSAASPLITDSSEHSQVIGTQAIVELPLNGRDYASLALLATNAVESPIAVSFGPTGTPREGAFNVNGMRSTYNNFMLDGLDNNAYGTSNQGYSAQVVQPSPDALAEFQVVTSNYSAEYGRVGGAVVNAVLRSGTNQFHGTAYEFLRNTDLNAAGYDFASTVFVKPPLQRNQFGTTIGGPFIKNKLFFFADYEGLRQSQRYFNFDSIPDVSDRQGILPVTVVDPLTKTVYPAGTQIPISTLNLFAAQVLNNLPAPNGPGIANNYAALLLVRDYGDKYDAKIDGQINDRMSAFLRFSQRKDLDYYQPDIPGPSGGDGNGYIHTIDQNASAGYNWIVTPSSVLEARFGFDHVLAGKEPAYLGGPSMEELYGIAGLPTSPDLTGGLNSQNISGFSQLGRQTSNPQFQNPTSFNPKFDYSWNKGRHSLKVGYEFLDVRTEILDVNPLYGEDQYTGQFSKPTCAELSEPATCTIPNSSSSVTSYNLADFIFGTPSIINLGNDAVVNLRQHVHSLFIQDDFRVTSKLTLNAGLRWDYATPLYERNNNYSDFDPATGSMVQATSGSLYNRSLVHPDDKDFGPRLGLAYSIDSKTVVRAGYGISYTFFNRVGSALEGINAPQELFGVISQSIPAGGPVPANFLTTQNSFTTGIDNPASFNPANSNVVYIPSNTKWPYVQNWFFSLQRELGKNTLLEVAYNGNHSLRLPIIADYNEVIPGIGKPVPNYGPITWVDPTGDNDYNGLSTRVEHRFGNGLYFLNSFTWGKALGDSEQALEYFSGYVEANPQNINNLAAERGPSSYDVKLNNVTSVVYELPFGKGKQFGSSWNPVLNEVLGGWELNTINTAHTGQPLNVYYSSSVESALSNDYRGEPFLRPNVSGSAVSQSTSSMINNYFAGYTFTTPSAASPFGDLGRNAFRAPNFEQWDLGVDKTFQIREDIRLQFRSEFFNVLNNVNFGIPNTVSNNSAFGEIRTTYPAREIQFALKLLF
jgi:hypothetical protein